MFLMPSPPYGQSMFIPLENLNVLLDYTGLCGKLNAGLGILENETMELVIILELLDQTLEHEFWNLE